jgi:hypothetical protein
MPLGRLPAIAVLINGISHSFWSQMHTTKGQEYQTRSRAVRTEITEKNRQIAEVHTPAVVEIALAIEAAHPAARPERTQQARQVAEIAVAIVVYVSEHRTQSE